MDNEDNPASERPVDNPVVEMKSGESQGNDKVSDSVGRGSGEGDRPVELAAPGGAGLPGIVSADEEHESRTRREITQTTRGLEYTISMKTKSLNSAISSYRKGSSAIECLIADSENSTSLRESRDKLCAELNEVSAILYDLSKLEGITDLDALSAKIDELQVSHHETLKRITDKLLDLEMDSKSHHSSSSSRSSRSRRSSGSRHSSHSNRSGRSSNNLKVEAAAELAALKTEIEYADIEASHRASLEKLQLQKRVDIASARLSVIEEADPLNGSHEAFRQPKSTSALNVSATPYFPQGPQTELKYVSSPIPAPVAAETSLQIIELTKTLTDQIQLGRYSAPEPSIFSGEPLQYPSWKSGFDLLFDKRNIEDAEKLYIMKRYLAGEAKEAVEGYLLMPTAESYHAARQLLEERYGNPSSVANAFRDKIDNWPKIPTRDGTALRKLSDFLQQCLLAMKFNTSLSILDDERENQKILLKMPDWFLSRWVRVVSEWRSRTGQFPPFSEFAKFIAKEAKIACDQTASMQALARETKPNNQPVVSKVERPPAKLHGRVFATESAAKPAAEGDGLEQRPPWCFLCRRYIHALEDCADYLGKSYEERRQVIFDKGLCFGCLRKGHLTRECRSRRTCATCGERHPSSLHKSEEDDKAPRTTFSTKNYTEESGSSPSCKASTVVPVLVSHVLNPHDERLVYAMLDTQSDTTFILEKTRTALRAPGIKTSLLLSTMSCTAHQVDTHRVSGLRVRGIDGEALINLPPSYTRDVMPVNSDHIPTPDTAQQWPHLRSLVPQLRPLQDCEVGLLIGYNCPQALVPREVIPDPHNQGPYGQRTDLGWSIVGITDPVQMEGDVFGISHRTLSSESNIVLRSEIKEVIKPQSFPSSDDLLKVLEQDFIEKSGPLGEEPYSQDDARFMRIMTEEIQTTADGHYQMPLPLRDELLPLPNNRRMAIKRLMSLQRKLERDGELHRAYTVVVEDLIEKGYAEPAKPKLESWFLPHHGVKHPRKPGKVRVVFDASARLGGSSLNDVLIQGPDLTNKLVGVLCRFREESIAISCDVEAMFHQFKVPEKHRDFLRFLWWPGGDLTRDPEEFRMTVHLFGATSSPSCANFGLKQIAKEHGSKFEKTASQFVKDDFYVDDGLSSQPTVMEASTLVEHTTKMCSLAGLNLHKVLSNSDAIMASVKPEARGQASIGKNPTSSIERVLGICWTVANDTLGFQVEIQDQPLTRRGILSTVASIYDPLGLAAPVLLKGKQILQELCRLKLDWDSPIPESISKQWTHWRKEVVLLDHLEIPRCYKPINFGTVVKRELHHFADASLIGYGTCSYLRQVNAEGQIHCSLVLGKARVSPLKPVTVPRLELNAAVIAIRISRFLDHELRGEVTHHFWTDSQAVLGYIANETSRYKIFVANRIQEIRDSSEPSQWRHVATDHNPADLASRGCDTKELTTSDLWFKGPAFLWQTAIPTPEIKVDTPLETDLVETCTLATRGAEDQSILTSLNKMSSWSKIKRVVALCMNLKTALLGDLKPSTLSPTQLQRAEDAVIKLVQRSSFTQEIKALSSEDKCLAQSSAIAKLDPFIDETGMLRVGGRIKHCDLPYKAKHPVLLPKDNHISETILTYCHQKIAHQGRCATINETRNRGFWVVGCSRSVARLISKCVKCRCNRGQTSGQKMADLPSDRLEATPPFSYCGVDYFGPFLVKEGRKELKRWGCLFTCLTSRAIHLEVAKDMSTDSYLNVLRRFISLRGQVKRIRCDRGTNFVGACNELKAALNEMDDEKIQRFMAEQGCEYLFNTPHSSHMGGVWERCIRTVRTILSSLLKEHSKILDDDSLRTLLAEASAIVNSRPPSVEQLGDVTAPIPISPSNLLTLKSSVVLPPPGKFQDADVYSRKRWRRVQHLANEFWTRWRKEYVHQLQSRQKWTRPQRNHVVGDIVLICDVDTPRCNWRVGRITEIMEGDDGLARKAKVIAGDPGLDSKGRRNAPLCEYLRPIHKLVLLLEA